MDAFSTCYWRASYLNPTEEHIAALCATAPDYLVVGFFLEERGVRMMTFQYYVLPKTKATLEATMRGHSLMLPFRNEPEMIALVNFMLQMEHCLTFGYMPSSAGRAILAARARMGMTSS